MDRSDDSPQVVLDSRLRMRSVAGMDVLEGNVMPNITNGSTISPKRMEAEKATLWILQGV